ncbi:MAG: universal stress protein [Pseudomonadota bacterium]
MYHHKIVVLLEQPVAHSAALERALAMARITGAEVKLCVFVHWLAVDAVEQLDAGVAGLARKALMAESESWLHRQQKRLQAAGIHNSAEIVWERPMRTRMLEKIHQEKPDLVIKEIQTESPLKRLMLTPVDWHLLRESGCDLMLVHADSTALPPQVLAAVDPVSTVHSAGKLNERVVDAARFMAALRPCDVELAHVFESPHPMTLVEPVVYSSAFDKLYEQSRQVSRERFRAFAEQHQIPAAAQHLLYGPPWVALSQQAGEAPGNLLVLGSVHRSDLAAWVLGSTAERILDDARCDLLVVRPAKSATAEPGLSRWA